MKRLPHASFHLVFSIVMAAIMVSVVTFVITAVNVGWSAGFLLMWAQACAVAFVVAVPEIFVCAPLPRRAFGPHTDMAAHRPD